MWVELKAISVTYFLISICDGEQHATTPGGGFGDDRDGEVFVERVGHEWLGGAAHVGLRSEAVRRVPLEAGDEGDGGREGDADQVREVEGSQGTALCRKPAWRGTVLEEGNWEYISTSYWHI